MSQANAQNESAQNQQPESIYADYSHWFKKPEWTLTQAVWLLIGLDPDLAELNPQKLPQTLREELQIYEATLGKCDVLIDDYQILISDLMTKNANETWVLNGDAIRPKRFLQWCFDRHIPWHEQLQAYLNKNKQDLRYSDDSEMLRVIKRLAKQDSWLLWEAALLTLGLNPDMTMTALIKRRNLKHGQESLERDALSQASYLADMARGSWRAGKLSIVNKKEVQADLSLFVLQDPLEPQAEIFPKEFLIWAQSKGYKPPVQLLECLGMESVKTVPGTSSISDYTTPYLQLMQKAIDVHRITDQNQPVKKTLEAWFLEQKIDGKSVSANGAAYMASFVRSPDARKGGGRKYS